MSKRIALLVLMVISLTAAGVVYTALEASSSLQAVPIPDGMPIPIPPLAELVGDATDDATATARILNYYTANHDALVVAFNEADETRLRALFGMYIVHVDVPYNVVDVLPVTLLDFVQSSTAHCGTYSLAQSQIYDAFGLTWRFVLADGGWHGIMEVLVGRQYETFDATSNVWVNLSIGEMIAGMTYTVMDEPRRYREFYAPVLDPTTSDSFRVHLTDERCDRCSVPQIRAGFSQWGLRVFPSRWEVDRLSANS